MWPKNFTYACYAINGLLSTCACVVSLVVFRYSTILKKPPGFLIFWQIVWELMISLVFTIQGFNGLDDIDKQPCRVLGSILVFGWTSTWIYSF
jgi:hypothetical protein